MIKELACYFLSSQTVRARMFLSYSVFTGLVNGEIIPFFPQRFHFEFSSSWAGIPLKTISNKSARHMFLSVTLSFLSFGSRVEDRTTLYARVHRIASPYDFEEESRDPETGVQRGSRQIDNSERFSKDSGNQRAYNLRRRTIFTLRVCFHWPDKRYLPIIIIARLDALHVLFRSILSSTRDLIIAITRRCITFSMYHVRLILRIVSMYAVDFSVQSSVISYKRRWIQRVRIDFNPRGKRFNRSR